MISNVAKVHDRRSHGSRLQTLYRRWSLGCEIFYAGNDAARRSAAGARIFDA